MCKYKHLSECKKTIFTLFAIIGVVKLNQAAEINGLFENDHATNEEIVALLDFETDLIYYRDEQLKVCLVENFDTVHQNGGLLITPEHIPTIKPEVTENITSHANQFCEDFPVYALSNLKGMNFVQFEISNQAVARNKRSAHQWYPGGAGGASQSQVQGQVSGQGFFSGQAQSQISGASQTQVQLNGNGILGSVSSSAGNAQAQIALGEYTGSGQAGSLGMGPSKSQVQVNLGQDGRGSMASAGVLADEGYSPDGRTQQYGNSGFDSEVQGFGTPRGSSSMHPGSGVGHYRDNSMSHGPGIGSGGNDYQTTSYGGSRNPGLRNPVYNSYPGYQVTPTLNGGRAIGNNMYPTSHSVPHSAPANLPQLPDIGFPSTDHHGGMNFEDLRTEGGFPSGQEGLGPLLTNGGVPIGSGGISYPGSGSHTNNGADYGIIGSYRQPTIGRQYSVPTSSGQQGRNVGNGAYSLSGNRYGNGRGSQSGGTSYAGGAGLPHAIASSYGTSQAQAQSQSQMVHLGRGTTEFYRPQQYGIRNVHPQSTFAQHDTGRQNGDTPFRNGVQYLAAGNGRATGIQNRPGNGQQDVPQQHAVSNGRQGQTSSGHNTTRETIRDGYIPTDDGYVRPYLNGYPRQQAGTNGNGQYPATFSTRSPVTAAPRAPVTHAPASYLGHQSVDQQTQQYPNFTPPSSQPTTRTNGNGIYHSPGGGNISNGNGYYPTVGQTYSSQLPISGHDTISQGYYPTTYGKPGGSGYNGGSNGSGKKCSVVTFTCTILIESNGRAKICRPNGSNTGSTTGGGGDYGAGQIDHGRPLQICCC